MPAKRQLRFIVDGQSIVKDPNCNFDGIVSNTENYLEAVFSLSYEWKDCLVAASFYRINDEFPVLLSGNKCMIPKEALTWDYFDVALTGLNKRQGYSITTGKVRVVQKRRSQS